MPRPQMEAFTRWGGEGGVGWWEPGRRLRWRGGPPVCSRRRAAAIQLSKPHKGFNARARHTRQGDYRTHHTHVHSATRGAPPRRARKYAIYTRTLRLCSVSASVSCVRRSDGERVYYIPHGSARTQVCPIIGANVPAHRSFAAPTQLYALVRARAWPLPPASHLPPPASGGRRSALPSLCELVVVVSRVLAVNVEQRGAACDQEEAREREERRDAVA